MNQFRILALFALIALTLAACGGGGSDEAQSIVDEATLQGIESGNFDLALDASVKGSEKGHVHFRVSGPFDGRGGKASPDLRLMVEAHGSLGDERIDFDGGLTVFGGKAYIGYEGIAYEVDPTTLNLARSAIRQLGDPQSREGGACREGIDDLKPSDFVNDLSEKKGVVLYSTPTTEVNGDLDVSALLDALQELAEDPVCGEQLEETGALPSAAELEVASRDAQTSVKTAQADLFIDRNRILHRIEARVKVNRPKGSDAGFDSVYLDLESTLTGLNEDQAIYAPEETEPLSNLFAKLGIDPIELLEALEDQGASGAIGNLVKTVR